MLVPPATTIDGSDDVAAINADIPEQMIGKIADMADVVPALPLPCPPPKEHPAHGR